MLFSLFPPITKTNNSSPKESWKEVKKDPQLGGQWKVPSLVALGKNPMLGGQWGNIFVWWSMEGSKLGTL